MRHSLGLWMSEYPTHERRIRSKSKNVLERSLQLAPDWQIICQQVVRPHSVPPSFPLGQRHTLLVFRINCTLTEPGAHDCMATDCKRFQTIGITRLAQRLYFKCISTSQKVVLMEFACIHETFSPTSDSIFWIARASGVGWGD